MRRRLTFASLSQHIRLWDKGSELKHPPRGQGHKKRPPVKQKKPAAQATQKNPHKKPPKNKPAAGGQGKKQTLNKHGQHQMKKKPTKKKGQHGVAPVFFKKTTNSPGIKKRPKKPSKKKPLTKKPLTKKPLTKKPLAKKPLTKKPLKKKPKTLEAALPEAVSGRRSDKFSEWGRHEGTERKNTDEEKVLEKRSRRLEDVRRQKRLGGGRRSENWRDLGETQGQRRRWVSKDAYFVIINCICQIVDISILLLKCVLCIVIVAVDLILDLYFK